MAFTPSDDLAPYVLCHVATAGAEAAAAAAAGAEGLSPAVADAVRDIAAVASLVRTRLLAALAQAGPCTPSLFIRSDLTVSTQIGWGGQTGSLISLSQ